MEECSEIVVGFVSRNYGKLIEGREQEDKLWERAYGLTLAVTKIC